MYKDAIRRSYKFQTNVGVLTIGQLFTASDATLIQLEEDLKIEVKSAKRPNRFQKSAVKDKLPKLKLAIVSDIIDTIIDERDVVADATINKEKEQKLLAALSKKRDEALDNMSEEEIEKALAKLQKK